MIRHIYVQRVNTIKPLLKTLLPANVEVVCVLDNISLQSVAFHPHHFVSVIKVLMLLSVSLVPIVKHDMICAVNYTIVICFDIFKHVTV